MHITIQNKKTNTHYTITYKTYKTVSMHTPAVLHVLRFIHSRCNLDFEVFHRTVLGSFHLIPLGYLGAGCGRPQQHLTYVSYSTHIQKLGYNQSTIDQQTHTSAQLIFDLVMVRDGLYLITTLQRMTYLLLLNT